MLYGVTGKILRVDLDHQRTSVEEPDEAFYRTYGGGLSGLLLPSQGAPGRGRTSVSGQPPHLRLRAAGRHGHPGGQPVLGSRDLTTDGCYGEAEAGGWWSPELKKAGYDAIVVEGAAENPVYLFDRRRHGADT